MFYDFVFFQFFCLEPKKPKECKGRRLIFIEHLNCPVRHFVHIFSFKSHKSHQRLGASPALYVWEHEEPAAVPQPVRREHGRESSRHNLWSRTRLAKVGPFAAFSFMSFQDKVKYKSVYLKIQHFMKKKRLSGLDINEDTYRQRHHC